MKKLSIIIPMYNVAQYLEKCVGSVYNQGMKEDDFEIILVDDQSLDNSLAVATSLTKDKTNVTIISQENRGLGGARNTGMRHAKGMYFLFLDSDDWCLPNTLENILDIAIKNRLDILEFAAQGITTDNKITYKYGLVSNTILDGIEYYNSVRYMNSACNKLYKKEFLMKKELSFSEGIFVEDFEFNTRVFAKAKRVFATDFFVSQFLQSPNSITRNTNVIKKEKMVNDLITVLQKTKETYQSQIHSDDLQMHNYFKERLGFIVITLFYQLFKNNATYREILKLKLKLIDQELFYIHHPVFQKNKDWFRKTMLKNFWLFKISQPLMSYLKYNRLFYN